ncbi:hypothetical protein PFLUV_G00127760 [Perca fluviatilis]|uniref:Uncharacterized protein n=1 Tax=Perca fluviatilis TaxID=8168 RepID=A0A6A5E839_PERFL|nr:hypothetical protein PFLUV_G00127760 [Perca fluviatilis]
MLAGYVNGPIHGPCEATGTLTHARTHANGGTTDRLNCTLCGKKDLVRLDKLLQESHDLFLQEMRKFHAWKWKFQKIPTRKIWRSKIPGPLPLSPALGPVPGPDHSPSSTDETGIRDTAGQPLHPTPVPGPHNYSTSTGPTAGQLLPSTPLPGSPISSTIQVSTVSNCQGCNQLSFRVLQLENLLMAAQTPIRRPSKLPLSAQKGEHVSKATKGENLFERILKDFQKFRLGSRSGKKDTENARQSASHGLRFCLYKASGLPPNAITEDLRFLTQIYKLQAFTAYLSNKGYAPTTIKNMLNNVILFLPHVENSFQKATDSGTDRKRTLPWGEDHSILMGYIMGYLGMLSGHRSVAIPNMTKKQVINRELEEWKAIPSSG